MHDFGFLNDEVLARRLAALGVRAADCEERFILGSGAGGQKVNKTSSTVQLRHVPTGTEVRMQQERSQTRNRELAWSELATKLEQARSAAAAAARNARELKKRQNRQKSRGQKQRMIQSKRHGAKRRAARQGGRGGWDE